MMRVVEDSLLFKIKKIDTLLSETCIIIITISKKINFQQHNIKFAVIFQTIEKYSLYFTKQKMYNVQCIVHPARVCFS